MNKPDIKDYPPRSPHELEWGGCNPQYFDDMRRWEDENKPKVWLSDTELDNYKKAELIKSANLISVILPK